MILVCRSGLSLRYDILFIGLHTQGLVDGLQGPAISFAGFLHQFFSGLACVYVCFAGTFEV